MKKLKLSLSPSTQQLPSTTSFLIIFITLFTFQLSAQSSSLKGKVLDKEIKEPIPFANVIIQKGDEIITGTTSDIDGNYLIKQIPSGIYTIKTSYIGYKSFSLENIALDAGEIKHYDLEIENTVHVMEVFVVSDFQDPHTICFCCRCCCITDNKIEKEKTVEEIIDHELLVFPNPCSSTLNIIPTTNAGDLFVVDLSGKILNQIKFTDLTKVQIDMSSYPSGVYFIRQFDRLGTGDSSTEKIIVAH